MRSREELAAWARRRISEAKTNGNAAVLVADDRAFMVTGSIGYCGYVTSEGEVYLDQDSWDSDPGTFREDRSSAARVQVLVLASRRYPELVEWLPDRTSRDPECATCGGTGWRQIATASILCDACSGLGWLPVDGRAG